MAYKIVEQVKLRGPFLSYADFVNRRIQGNRINLLGFPFPQWNTDEKRNQKFRLGLRGAIQAGIAEARLNHGGFSIQSSQSLPFIPKNRLMEITFWIIPGHWHRTWISTVSSNLGFMRLVHQYCLSLIK